jgi:hypothetical protein
VVLPADLQNRDGRAVKRKYKNEIIGPDVDVYNPAAQVVERQRRLTYAPAYFCEYREPNGMKCDVDIGKLETSCRSICRIYT